MQDLAVILAALAVNAVLTAAPFLLQ